MTLNAPIPAYFSPQHTRHAPATEFLHGRIIPYAEKPQRIEVIRDALAAAGLIRVIEPDARIDEEQIARVHDPHMIAYLKDTSAQARALVERDLAVYRLDPLPDGDEYFYASVYPLKHMTSAQRYYVFDNCAPIGTGTWEAARASALVAQAAARSLLANETRLAYALCRPPGHHAGPDFMGGYCYFNNAAIAADWLTGLGKVAILDVDYHHGNGTQAIFWDDPRVLYTSIHGDPAAEYPYHAGFASETGGPRAPGTTLNVPLPQGTGPEPYHAGLDALLARIREFAPASLIVSIGYDSYKDDPISTFKLDDADFTRMGRAVASFNLPTLLVQEGGYHLESLGRLAVAFVQGAAGQA